MIVIANCNFIENKTEPFESKSQFNYAGNVLSLQTTIEGNANCIVEGRVNSSQDWVPLALVNLSNFNISEGKIEKAGIYEASITSIREIRVRVIEVLGTISVIGQIISEVEV